MKKLFALYFVIVNVLFGQLSNLTYYDSLKARLILDKLTLREKCAQMVFAHGYAYDASDSSEEFLRLNALTENEKIGGVLFLTGDAKVLPDMINKLQKSAKIPLIISADFENGVGGRMENATEFPPPMAIAATQDTANAFLAAEITAKKMRLLGVTQNFAPVLDINSNYKNPIINYRAFSDDKKIVADFGAAYIRGMQSAGVLATAKHFPGHGATDLDSHNELPLISESKSELFSNELVPFRKAINSGVSSIMLAHLNVPALTGDSIPVTLSKKAVTDILKGTLGFNGLCVSDAMNMHAVTERYGEKEAVIAAVNAGIDVILFPVNERDAIEAIYDGVLFREIDEKRVLDAAYKIILAKMRLGLFRNKFTDTEKAVKSLENKKDKRFAYALAEKSTTLARNEENIIPIEKSKYKSPLLIVLRQTERKDLLEKERPLKKFIKARMPNIRVAELSKLSAKADFDKAYKLAQKSDLILFAAYIGVQSFSGEIEPDSAFVELGNKILKSGKLFVLLSSGNPYSLAYLPEVKTNLISYGICDACEAAATEALFGEIDISGELPITVPVVNVKNGFGISLKRNRLVFQKNAEDSLYDFSQVDSLMYDAIKRRTFPGAQLLVARNGKAILNKCYGRFTYSPKSPEVNYNTLYDLASLTKVLSTTTAAMILYEQGKLKLSDYVYKYLPEFDNNGKDKITIEQLLLHTSGLPAGHRFYKKFSARREVINAIMNEKLINEPGEKFVYSDLGMIVLQLVIEKITGMPLDKFVYDNVFSKLNLSHITYNPSQASKKFCAPTEKDNYWRRKLVQGEVHDETAALLGGVSGNAGLFSNAEDIGVFVQMLLDGGVYKNKRILKKETIDFFTARRENDRALGWDTKSAEGYTSAGSLFSLNSFGHTGFTGTSIWVDKERKLFVILLTNRVYPTRKNREHIKFRPVLHDAVIRAVEN